MIATWKSGASPRNRRATRIAVADVPSAAIAIRVSNRPHQLLEHKNRARNRRVERNSEPGACTGGEKRSAIRPAAAGHLPDDVGDHRPHLHARPLAAERRPGTDRQNTAEEFHQYQMRRRRRQPPVERRLDLRDAAPRGVRRKPPDEPSRSRNGGPGAGGHQQETREPSIVRPCDRGFAKAIGVHQRKPEARADQARSPARDQGQQCKQQ